jgi:hypothetical protein
MKLKTKFLFTVCCLSLCVHSFGQLKQYDFKRELQGVKTSPNDINLYKIILPNEIFAKVMDNLADIRVYRINESKDTMEVPYILRVDSDKTSKKEVAFDLFNQSKNNKGYYFTFEVPKDRPVNQIKLEFKQQNFDWKLALEGSQNQEEWFSIIDDYRILSIKNNLTDFKFTTVSFHASSYRYFRLLVKSDLKPELTTAKLSLDEVSKGNFRKYLINTIKTDEEKKNRQSIINIDLQQTVPVSFLKINIQDKFDFYRPVTIRYLTDSFKTEQGWIYNYNTLTSGTLNSIEKNEFGFNSTILKKLRIIIDNNDNEPLKIDSVNVMGYEHELIARFNEPGNYFLVYGNKNARKPNYDLSRFSDKIPATLTALELGDEQLIDKEKINKEEPLFQNKAWLWLIMAFIIIVLGWFSFNMMRKK